MQLSRMKAFLVKRDVKDYKMPSNAISFPWNNFFFGWKNLEKIWISMDERNESFSIISRNFSKIWLFAKKKTCNRMWNQKKTNRKISAIRHQMCKIPIGIFIQQFQVWAMNIETTFNALKRNVNTFEYKRLPLWKFLKNLIICQICFKKFFSFKYIWLL